MVPSWRQQGHSMRRESGDADRRGIQVLLRSLKIKKLMIDLLRLLVCWLAWGSLLRKHQPWIPPVEQTEESGVGLDEKKDLVQEKTWALLGRYLSQYVLYTGPSTAWLLRYIIGSVLCFYVAYASKHVCALCAYYPLYISTYIKVLLFISVMT